MNVFIADLVPLATAVAAIAGIIMTLISLRKSERRRAAELLAATDMLGTHYDAVSQVVDDPALPLGALESLTSLIDALQDESFVQSIVSEMVNDFGQVRNKDKAPAWFGEIEGMRATRPELVIAYEKAVATGIVGAIARYKSTAPMLPKLAQILAQGNKKQAIIADRAVRNRKEGGGRHLPPSAGMMIPA